MGLVLRTGRMPHRLQSKLERRRSFRSLVVADDELRGRAALLFPWLLAKQQGRLAALTPSVKEKNSKASKEKNNRLGFLALFSRLNYQQNTQFLKYP